METQKHNEYKKYCELHARNLYSIYGIHGGLLLIETVLYNFS